MVTDLVAHFSASKQNINFNLLPPFKIPGDAILSACLGFLSSQGMRWCFRVCICSAALALPLVHQPDTSELPVYVCLGLCGHPLASCVLGSAENESVTFRPQRSNAHYEDTVMIWARSAASNSGQNLVIAN